MATPRGIDVRESGNGLLVRARLVDAYGNPLGPGAEQAQLRLAEFQPDATLRQADFGATPGTTALSFWGPADAHAFVNATLPLAGQDFPDGTGTGLWSAFIPAAAIGAAMVAGRIYAAQVAHSQAAQPALREFQYGGVEGDATAGGGGGGGSGTGASQASVDALADAVAALRASLVKVPVGTILSATATDLTVSGLTGSAGQYRGARARLAFADGTVEPAGNVLADAPGSGGNRVLSFAALVRVPLAGDSLEVYG